MTESTHQQLIGHLVGALDDNEQVWMDEWLEHDESCREELTLWRRRLAPLEAIRPDYEPPPGLAKRTCRMVAAYGPAPSPPKAARSAMSPDPTVPAAVSLFGWHDVVAVGVLILTAVALLFPAIDDSRFQSDLASCQDNLRRFGLAMNQYSGRHREDISQFADNGNLTAAGVAAADLIDDAPPHTNQHLCPKAWLAAQGAVRNLSSTDTQGVVPPNPGASVPGHFYAHTSNDWSGDWRDGTTDGLGDCRSAILALFADDPSVELPGRRLCGHRGRGRNLFFRDGRIGFVPCSTGVDSADDLLPFVKSIPSDDVSAPIIYVNHR